MNLRQGTWRSAVVSLDGALHEVVTTPHRSRQPQAVLASIQAAVENTKTQYGDRLRVVSLAVAGTVRENRLMQASTLGWDEVELSPVVGETGLTLLAGNDATLSGVAESRTGAAAGARTALHLIVEVGLGGTLILDGNPASGATGVAGEYGHMPFGDRSLRCPCGASGCWDLDVDGRALARRLGEDEPDDPFTYAESVLQRTDSAASAAIALSATALGSGIAGLVNAHDPDVITLGGLAVPLRKSAPDAFDTAYRDGLMRFHRGSPPPILDSAHEADGALLGAAALGLDHITTEPAIATWAEPTL
ncbi:ROK family protein [Kribbella qitaiheensis]|uniref:ROK family protein n=1 Tax=Kribbella qitaiheensis TaxID=1544730 RepID=UPI001FE2824D|nr:ROK family protein [Kribbella qitaiheensis]